LYFLAAIPAVIIGIVVWFLASPAIAASIEWVENRRPDLVGSKQLRVGEAVACGALVLATFALAFWIVRLLVTQMK
jgi:ABC-type phosphate transport system permease subunit